LFTPRFGDSTHTNPRGVEVYLAPDALPLRPGVPINARVRAVQVGAGNAPIQPGGLVLSGAGSAATFLRPLKPGLEITLEAQFYPPLKPGTQIIGGGPRLVSKGRVDLRDEHGILTASFAERRHPRTALGLAGDRLLLVTVDGRQPGYSVGMTLQELAQQMVDLGCEDAMNLDGGGSTTMWTRGVVRNRPSDGQERKVANALIVFSTAPRGRAARLLGLPQAVDVLAGSVWQWPVSAEDQYYNPVDLQPGSLHWSTDVPGLRISTAGRMEAGREVTPNPGEAFASGTITARLGDLRQRCVVRVYPRPERLALDPPAAELLLGEGLRFQAQAFGPGGRLLLASPEAFTWQCDSKIGRVGADGAFQAGEQEAAGAVSIAFGEARAEATVRVGGASRLIAGFEGSGSWSVAVKPPDLPGSVKLSATRAHSGRRSLALQYDFSAPAEGVRAVYARADRTLGSAVRLRAWVYGDGQEGWLRAHVRDADGATHYLTLARRVDWSGEWREVSAALPTKAPAPLVLESLYVVETDPNQHPRGTVFVDDLRADFRPENGG